MNLYPTKISRSYVKGVMKYQGSARPPPPLVCDVLPKPLVSEGLRSSRCENFEQLKHSPNDKFTVNYYQYVRNSVFSNCKLHPVSGYMEKSKVTSSLGLYGEIKEICWEGTLVCHILLLHK